MSLAKIYGQKVHISLKLANSMQVGQSSPSLIKILKDSLLENQLSMSSTTLVLNHYHYHQHHYYCYWSVCNQIICEPLSNLLELWFFLCVLASFLSLTGPVCIAFFIIVFFLICVNCLFYLFVFSKENIQFCGWVCTFLFHPCIHQSNCRSSRSYFFIPEHTFDILSKIPFWSWKYFWSFQLILQWLFDENFI